MSVDNLQSKLNKKQSLEKEEKFLPKNNEISEKYLKKGEELLLKKDLKGIEFLKKALKLTPNSFDLWYRKGKVLLNFKKNKKFLLLAMKSFQRASLLSPSSIKNSTLLTKSLFLLGKKTRNIKYLQKAKEILKKAIKKEKTKKYLFNLHFNLANLWMNLFSLSKEPFELKKAIESYKSAFLHKNLPSKEFLFSFGYAYFQLALFTNNNNFYKEAILQFYQALKISKKFKKAWVFLADSYRELYINTEEENCFEKAKSSYEEYLKLDPNSEKVTLKLANLLKKNGYLTKDLKKLKLSIEKYKLLKKTADIEASILEVFSLLGEYSSDLNLIKKSENKIKKLLQKHPKNKNLLYSYGISFKAQSIYFENDLFFEEKALKKFKKALFLDKKNKELLHAIALAYSNIGLETEDLKILKKAINYFSLALKEKPSCATLLFDFSKSLFKIAEITENKHILKLSLFYIEKLLKNTFAKKVNWIFLYGRILATLPEILNENFSENKKKLLYKKAINCFKKVALLNPSYPSINYYIGLCYSNLEEILFLKKALFYFKKALKNNEEDDSAHLEYGLTLISLAEEFPLYQKRYYEKAENKILKSGFLGNEHAYYYLACLYSILNRKEESINLLKKAHKQKILPSLKDLLEDEWLENAKNTKAFSDFIAFIEKAK
jgi:tetratricopeptide (TPR) repeat protein